MTSSPQTTPSDDTHRSDADENILAELSRILASPQFTRTSRSKRFLEYIVNETLCGRGDDLKGYTIAIDVFDKSINFDSSQNTVVRVQALQVRRRLKLYYAEKTGPTGVHISLPKGRYKPTFLIQASGPILEKTATNNFKPNLAHPILHIQPLKNHSEEQIYQSFTDSVTMELIHKLSELDAFQVKLDDRDFVTMDKPIEDFEMVIPSLAENQNIAATPEALPEGYTLTGFIRRKDLEVRMTVLLSLKADATIIKTQAFHDGFTPGNIFRAPETLAGHIVDFMEARPASRPL